ncbi:MAG: ankyrin repeat protein [Gammaproteobacteria bacterium]|jgi:ankyrin repeat protein
MSKHDSNEDLVSVVERNPRSKFPTSILFVFCAIFLLLSYFYKKNTEVDTVAQATYSSSEKLIDAPDVFDIHHLISNGRVDEFKQKILSVDREAINEVVGGMTPIMLAASAGNIEIIDLLFTQGADPNIRGSAERTALQYATERNHIDAAKRLLAYGADIDAYDNGGLTPLIMASNRGYTELGLWYIDKGANVNNQHNEGWTALIDAAVRDDAVLVEALLAAGADKNLATNKGLKAIDYARQYGHKTMVNILSK